MDSFNIAFSYKEEEISIKVRKLWKGDTAFYYFAHNGAGYNLYAELDDNANVNWRNEYGDDEFTDAAGAAIEDYLM